MPTETTRFVFEDVGGERIVRRFRDIGTAADRSRRAVDSLYTALRRIQGFGGGGGGGFGPMLALGGGNTINVLVRQTTTFNQQLNIIQRSALRTGQALLVIGQNGAQAFRTAQAGLRVLQEAIMQTGRLLNSLVVVTGRMANSMIREFGRISNALIRTVGGALQSVTRTLSRIVTNPFAVLGGALGGGLLLHQLITRADEWLNLQNRIAASSADAAASGALLARVQTEIYQIAQRARSPLQSLGELYGRLALGADRAVFSQQNLLRITETVAKAAAVGGGTQQSIEGALIQLSQIFGAGGAARGIGQELRSLREQAPVVFLAIAQGLGKTTTELEKLAEQGQLTSTQIGQALLKMSDEIDRRFLRIQPTIGQAFTVLSNAITRFIGLLSDASGAGNLFADMIIGLANRIERLAETVRPLALALRAAFGGEGSDLPYTANPNIELPGQAAIRRYVGAGGSIFVETGAAAETIGARVRQQLDLLRRTLLDSIKEMARGAGILLVEGIAFSIQQAIPILTAVGEFIGEKIAVGAVKVFRGIGGVIGEAFGSAVAANDPASSANTLSEALERFRANSRGLELIQQNATALNLTFRETLEVMTEAGNQISNIANKEVPDLNTKIADTTSAFDKLRKSFNQGMAEAVKKFNDLKDVAATVGETVGEALTSGIGDSLVDVVSGVKSAQEAFREFAIDVLQDLAKIIARFSLLRIIQATPLGGLFGFPAIPALANGGVLSQGYLMPFAAGGAFSGGYVVDRPTVFPMARGAGLMGEAGPEAVMPLERDDSGRLGVRAQGKGGGELVVVPVMVRDSGEVERMVSAREFDDALARLVRSGSATAAAIRGVRG